MKVRTALVTARSAPAHERAIRTLMNWKIAVDEAMFLGGLDKGPFLKEFEPDFFFDDQTRHCDSGAVAGPTGHVISGIANDQRKERQCPLRTQPSRTETNCPLPTTGVSIYPFHAPATAGATRSISLGSKGLGRM
jgi:hypothetical protein